MNRIAELQRQRNLASQNARADFASHRERVMGLLRGNAPANSGLLRIFGAGNCNDVDLTSLLEKFETIELVDLDGQAIASAVQRVGLAGEPRVKLLGNVDLLGAADELENWRAGHRDFNLLIQQLASNSFAIAEGCDVAISICLLTQLIESLEMFLGSNTPEFHQSVVVARAQHLRLLLETTKPGGAAILVTDIVSSVTVPQMDAWSDLELPQRIARLIEERNFFTGTNPAAIAAQIQNEPIISRLVASVRLMEPWRWRLGAKSYLVVAFVITRRAA